MTAIRLLDTTLRDGSHAMEHRFTRQQVRDVAAALDAAGVPVIEVCHGDGLAGSSLQCGFSSVPEMELIEVAAGACSRARLAVMVLPGMGTVASVREALARGASVVRVAVLCMEPDLAQRHLAAVKEAGAEAVGFMMVSHMRSPATLAEGARALESYGADCVYLADSAGAMLPDDVAARIAALKEAVGIGLGFHAHNNFGAGVANCVAALDAGADWLDGSLRGLGAGAGNAATELLAVVLQRRNEGGHLDLFGLLDAAESTVAPFMPFQPIPDRDSVLLGEVGIYSTFLSHARHAAEDHGVDVRRILVELGRRQAVVGQESLVTEIAEELAAA